MSTLPVIKRGEMFFSGRSFAPCSVTSGAELFSKSLFFSLEAWLLQVVKFELVESPAGAQGLQLQREQRGSPFYAFPFKMSGG